MYTINRMYTSCKYDVYHGQPIAVHVCTVNIKYTVKI